MRNSTLIEFKHKWKRSDITTTSKNKDNGTMPQLVEWSKLWAHKILLTTQDGNN